ncbi:MAG: flagellar basal body rod protein FlgB, partial [Candidatus Thiodiazotropha sp.]
MNFDNVFGIHERALTLRSQRAEVLASNLANADTPGFKARDFDFKAMLKSEMSDTVRLRT